MNIVMKKHNFNSGPSILPPTVLAKAAEAIIDFKETGLSILEIGHRTNWFVDVIEEAKMLVKKLMNIGEEYEVLFLQGGATTQFMQVPLNLLEETATASYCDDGVWGNKAYKEAHLFGKVHLAATSKDKNYTYINKHFDIPQTSSYLHLTTNNTVEGTQWFSFPDTTVPIVADMSSDIFSRQMDFDKFSLIYAGAQKNLGAAGVNLVVVKKEILGKVARKIPTILNYKNHIEANSLLNTPPVFAIYVSLLTLQWIEEQGGLIEMEKRSVEKSTLLYNVIDELPLFDCRINQDDRSRMNAVFFINDEILQNEFLEICKENGVVGVKGYRTVGGIRVSMYNALPTESVQMFCNLMKEFANKKG
jgi:phosphoserine aminotransferase